MAERVREIQVGDYLLASGEFVSPEEYERRQASMTPAAREFQRRMEAWFAREAKALRTAADQLESET